MLLFARSDNIQFIIIVKFNRWNLMVNDIYSIQCLFVGNHQAHVLVFSITGNFEEFRVFFHNISNIFI